MLLERESAAAWYGLAEVFWACGDTDAAMEAFARGVALADEKKWAEALAIFERLEDDPAAAVYARQCRKQLEDPTSTWDGVWGLAEK